jgi:hypothetical protein
MKKQTIQLSLIPDVVPDQVMTDKVKSKQLTIFDIPIKERPPKK